MLSPQSLLPNAEAQKSLQSEWDGGLIAAYLARPQTKHYTYSLPTAIAILDLWTDQDPEPVVNTVERLLLWLGVPAGFKVNLVMCPNLRQIKADDWPSRHSVNGGYAVPKSNSIVVYRAEEYERVILHESIHALGWDWPMGPTPPSCWDVDGTLAPHLFEAWTECYAEWLYCAYYNIPWAKQMAWQRNQALQILARAPKPWKEDTNVFAYYIVKAALAPHIQFLLPFQAGKTTEEKSFVLCGLIANTINHLRTEAASVMLVALSLRMSLKK